MANSDLSPEQLTGTSRFLALVLRHKPSAAGVRLDIHGWADVNELLRGMDRTHPIDIETLKKIVETDEKQRYSFNDDMTKIRANQGHSFYVEIEMEVKDPPEYLWHGTAERNAQSIEETGLNPASRLYVHLSKDSKTALSVGARHGKPVLYRVRSGEMARDGYRFLLSPNGVWQTKYVPPCYLDRVDHKDAETG